MKLKRTVILLTIVVTMGLLLGASAASWAQPEPATLISPSGTITDNTPTYTWNAVADSTHYQLFVWDSTKTKKIDQWYTAEQTNCSDGESECSVTNESMLANDSHEWWIRTWNGDGYGNWSDLLSILVAVSIPPAPVTKTGQTESFGEGDDGDLQKGVSVDQRFTENSDGTVTDNLTGLIWLKDANCFEDSGWWSALEASNDLADGQCGLSDDSVAGDWRLPNISELQSLVDYGNFSPALPTGHPFTNVNVNWRYWSSTTSVDDGKWYQFAWHMDWLFGNTDFDMHKSATLIVWPVRGGN
jgi:hypothetical protein